MKKVFAILMAAVMSLSLAACGSAASTGSDKTEPEAGSTSTAAYDYSSYTGETIDAIKKAGKLVVGTEAQYAPFEFKDMNANFVGCDMWLAQQIADALGVKLEVMDMSFDGIIPAVKSGQADIGIAAMTVDGERVKEIDFTEVYQKDEQKLIVKKGNESVYTSKESLAGEQVGAQRGTVQSKLVENALPESKLFELDKWPALALEVANGNIAAIVVDGAVADGLIANNDNIVIADFEFSKEDANFGKAGVLAKGHDDLKELVNAVITNVQNDGSFQAAYDEAVELSQSMGI